MRGVVKIIKLYIQRLEVRWAIIINAAEMFRAQRTLLFMCGAWLILIMYLHNRLKHTLVYLQKKKNYRLCVFLQCMKTCFSKNWEKPGSCPKLIQINDHSNSNHTTNSPAPFYLPCLKECRKDSDCSGIQKCCKHHCGSTCQPAQSLQNVSGNYIIIF